MAVTTERWGRSMLVLFGTIWLHGVNSYQLPVQRAECISQLVGQFDNIVSGKFSVVDKLIESSINEDTVEMLVTGPSGNNVLSMKAKGVQTFQFKASKVGAFKICFFNPTSAPKKVDFTIYVGVHPDLKDLARDENFDHLEAKIGQLRDALERVALEQEYYKARDVRHRHTNESTQNRLLWYTLFEYICLIAVSLAQVFLVQTFFSRRVAYNNI